MVRVSHRLTWVNGGLLALCLRRVSDGSGLCCARSFTPWYDGAHAVVLDSVRRRHIDAQLGLSVYRVCKDLYCSCNHNLPRIAVYFGCARGGVVQ